MLDTLTGMSAVSPHGDEQAASPPLDRGTAEALARSLRAVADPTRLQMLSIIAGSPESEVTVGEIANALGLRQPTITHHASIMIEDGLLVRHPRGRQVWLSIAPDRAASVADLLR